ncbi:methylated-DNA--protein-cysteine methyltransferase [Halobellus salinus]|uniref:Methylated-DNA--protein-cysteine methyltransferase n=1 Tax=Halobellus salinus TaxID=931585 RepID=A0A830EBX0_9EURY|nr:MGMT family protein [Halobellus salinus]GGJ09363.1 methylated-DNA--protein-cysteine methyltransferase [Halobellus salinus]SMP27310.1 methylated-DNA-[protein]-cysteine S-methyltransferase [Halobellus salinus]
MDGVFAREFESLERAVEIGIASDSVISVSFPADLDDAADGQHPLFDRIGAYLGGRSDHLDDVEVALTVPTDHRQVLEATRNIPHGKTVSLDRVIRMAGLDPDDDAARETARTALAGNPTPLFVPDHRVRDAPGGAPAGVAERLRAIESA